MRGDRGTRHKESSGPGHVSSTDDGQRLWGLPVPRKALRNNKRRHTGKAGVMWGHPTPHPRDREVLSGIVNTEEYLRHPSGGVNYKEH